MTETCSATVVNENALTVATVVCTQGLKGLINIIKVKMCRRLFNTLFCVSSSWRSICSFCRVYFNFFFLFFYSPFFPPFRLLDVALSMSVAAYRFFIRLFLSSLFLSPTAPTTMWNIYQKHYYSRRSGPCKVVFPPPLIPLAAAVRRDIIYELYNSVVDTWMSAVSRYIKIIFQRRKNRKKIKIYTKIRYLCTNWYTDSYWT